MTVRIADARKIPQILVKDNQGNIVKVINIGKLQVGFEGAESRLILTGGVDLATRLVELESNNASCYLKEEDLVVCIYSPSAAATVYLPSNPDQGRLFAIKDVAGVAGTYNITVTPPNGKLIDGSSSKALDSNYASFFVMWTGEEWVTLGGSGGGGGGTTVITSSGGPTGSFITVNSESGVEGERRATSDGSIVFTDGGANSTFQFALSNTGVTAGTYEYPTLTVDVQGRITNIFSNPIIWRLHTGTLTYTTPGYNTQSFYYTGTSSYWVVPLGVSHINVEMWGAGGSGWNATTGFGASFVSNGAAGGYTSASFNVTPGTVLEVKVGGRGKYGGEDGGEGGFGGYPDAGNGALYHNSTTVKGGGGGGGTWLLFNGITLAVAGGGGGGGSGTNQQGGNGGGNSGINDNTAPKAGYATVVDAVAGAGGASGAAAADGGGGGGGGYNLGNGGTSTSPNYTFAGGGGGGSGYVNTSYALAGYKTQTNSQTQTSRAEPPATGSKWYITGSINAYGLTSYNSGRRIGRGSNEVIGGAEPRSGDGFVVIEYYVDTSYTRSVAYTTSSVAIVNAESEIDQLMPLDVHFYVTGSKGISGISASLALFEGDTKFSGSVIGLGGFTGSLQQTYDGKSFLVAGGGISITSGTNQVVIASQNSDIPFLTLTSATGLTNERIFSVSGTSGLKMTDNGPGNTAALTINDNVVATISGSRFSGNVVATSGLSGSLQRTSAGISYLVAGQNITVTTQSNGQVLIDAATSASIAYFASGTWRDTGTAYVNTSSVSIDASNRAPSSIGSDVFFFVSGSKGVSSGATRKVSVFGGDIVDSGSAVFISGLTGTLQQTAGGLSYLVAGTNVAISSQSNGQVVINSTGGSGGSGDPDATYVVISTTSSLNNERRLAAGSNIFITDGGAGGDVTISTTSASSGTLTLASYHDTSNSPVALFQLSGNLNDSSNNALTALTVLSGTARYTDLTPGMKGLWLDGFTAIGHNSTEASLVITGSLTLESIAIISLSTLEQTLFGMIGPSADVNGSENYLYRLSVLPEGRLSYFAEQGNGTNIQYITTGAIPQGELIHIAMTRNTGGNVSFYLNGSLFETSTGVTSPNTGSTAASTARFRVGATEAGASFGSSYSILATKIALASIKVIASELSAVQIYQEFSRTLGPLYGINVIPTGTWRDRGNELSTTGSVSVDASNRSLSTIGSDVYFFVSGSQSVLSGNNRKVSLFGGDAHASGTITYTPYVISPTQITTETNNYAPTGFEIAEIVRLTASSSVGVPITVTGFSATGLKAVKKTLINVSTGSVTLRHESTGSTAANRIRVPGGLDLSMYQDDAVDLYYDSITGRWRVV